MTTIADDTHSFVRYGPNFTVIKGNSVHYSDSVDLYVNQVWFQTLLAPKFAPTIIEKDIPYTRNGHSFLLIVSEDVGLPIETSDIPDVNRYLDQLYDMGIAFHWFVHPSMFVRCFDGRIRATNFKQAAMREVPQHERLYLEG